LTPAAHIARIGDLDHAKEFLEMVRNQRIGRQAVVYPIDGSIASSPSPLSGEDEQKLLQGAAGHPC